MIRRADLDSTFRRSGSGLAAQHHAVAQQQAAAHQQQQYQQQQQQHQQAIAHQQAEAQKRDRAKRQSRRPTDRNIPPGLDDVVIGDGVKRYQALRDVERRLDAVMMRRRLDIQDSIKRDMRRYQTLRVWVSNTVENQPWQLTGVEPEAFDFTSENQATYRVRIEGRLIDGEEEEKILTGEDGGDAVTQGDQTVRDMDQGKEKDDRSDPMDTEHDEQGKNSEDEAKATTSSSDDENSHRPNRAKFSQFFKSITIDFDRSKSLQPDGMSQIGWKRSDKRPGTSSAVATAAAAPADSEFDCLEFERKGDENINITINLVRDENPERYKLSKPLADLIDSEEEDRAGVVMKVWEYVKAMGLQEDEENRRFQCDERLKAVCILVSNGLWSFYDARNDEVKPISD